MNGRIYKINSKKLSVDWARRTGQSEEGTGSKGFHSTFLYGFENVEPHIINSTSKSKCY